jgi:tRNA(Ile)-lysidine synthase TilS/MesJ
MRCSKCGMRAIFFQEYSGLYLCHQHFDADVEAKVKHEIRRHKWMVHGDHIAVALSGDAGSSALLFFLKKLTSDRQDIRISAICVDEGISGYRCPEDANQIADFLGIECIMGSFKETFGTAYDKITNSKKLACSYTCCHVLRDFVLNRVAREHGITKLAFGYTLDDAAVSVLMKVLQGRPEVLADPDRDFKGILPRIAPFIAVPENEVTLYADLHVKRYSQSASPYHNNQFEEDAYAMVNGFTHRHPGTKYALLDLGKNLYDVCVSMAGKGSIPSYGQCGKIVDGVCENCRIINEVIPNGT